MYNFVAIVLVCFLCAGINRYKGCIPYGCKRIPGVEGSRTAFTGLVQHYGGYTYLVYSRLLTQA